MARFDAFEDRKQSSRPANPNVGARNQGGRHNAPSAKSPQVKPPPVSRARKDSILRPVNDGGASQGGSRPGSRNVIPPPAPPAKRNGGGPLPGSAAFRNLSRPEQIAIERRLGGGPGSGKSNSEITANFQQRGGGPARKQNPGQERQHGRGGAPAPPVSRNRFGAPEPEAGLEGGVEFPPQSQEAGVAPTDAQPDQAQQEQNAAQMPPSSPANAGARQPQGPAEMGGNAFSDEGRPMPSAPAVPPQSDPEFQAEAGSPMESAAEMNELQAGASPDGFGGRMGEQLLGFNIEQSDQISNGQEWQGEIGPGKPANQSGAVGIPGQMNSPEDVQFNRQRFDSALQQSKGDKFAAAQSSGSFPSGNPVAHGTMKHMDRIVNSTDGDGVDTGSMDEQTRRRYQQDAVRQTEEFGAYPGMDDPESPTPPIRPLSWSFNPLTNKWVSPEGAESLIDRFGGGE